MKEEATPNPTFGQHEGPNEKQFAEMFARVKAAVEKQRDIRAYHEVSINPDPADRTMLHTGDKALDLAIECTMLLIEMDLNEDVKFRLLRTESHDSLVSARQHLVRLLQRAEQHYDRLPAPYGNILAKNKKYLSRIALYHPLLVTSGELLAEIPESDDLSPNMGPLKQLDGFAKDRLEEYFSKGMPKPQTKFRTSQRFGLIVSGLGILAAGACWLPATAPFMLTALAAIGVSPAAMPLVSVIVAMVAAYAVIEVLRERDAQNTLAHTRFHSEKKPTQKLFETIKEKTKVLSGQHSLVLLSLALSVMIGWLFFNPVMLAVASLPMVAQGAILVGGALALSSLVVGLVAVRLSTKVDIGVTWSGGQGSEEVRATAVAGARGQLAVDSGVGAHSPDPASETVEGVASGAPGPAHRSGVGEGGEV